VTFAEASQTLKGTLDDEELANVLGVSVQGIRQARLDEANPSYRSPPAGWPEAIARIARARAAELWALAERLEG
jgi:hypothetical protein